MVILPLRYCKTFSVTNYCCGSADNKSLPNKSISRTQTKASANGTETTQFIITPNKNISCSGSDKRTPQFSSTLLASNPTSSSPFPCLLVSIHSSLYLPLPLVLPIPLLLAFTLLLSLLVSSYSSYLYTTSLSMLILLFFFVFPSLYRIPFPPIIPFMF